MRNEKASKLLIFDCDGTLIDSERVLSGVQVELLKELFGIEYNLKDYIERFLGTGFKDKVVALNEDLAKKGQKLPDNFYELISERLKIVYPRDLESMPGVEAALEALNNPRCIASNTDTERLLFSLEASRMNKYFPVERVFSAAMVAHSKPAPDVFLFAAKQCGFEPHECLVIGDSKADVLAAKAAGMDVLCYVPDDDNLGPIKKLWSRALQSFNISHNKQAAELKRLGALYTFSDYKQLQSLVKKLG